VNLIGLDIGGRRIGVAVSRGENIIASPLRTLEYDDEDKVVAELARLIAAEKTDTVVFGVPLGHAAASGAGPTQEDRIRAFVERLRPACSAEFVAVDESFTTRTAEKAMSEMKVKRAKRKQLGDRLAAVLILQYYIDSRKSGSTKK